MAEKTIIFDLDHTLFDTNTFRRDLFNLLLKNSGILQKTLLASYDNYTKTGRNYSLGGHMAFLRDHYGNTLSKKKTAEVKEFLHSSLKKYLNKEALPALRELQTMGYKLLLLTKGDPYFQRIKIKQSGLDEIFKNNFFISRGDKIRTLLRLGLDKAAYFINDNYQETASVQARFVSFRCILYLRPDAHKFYRLSATPFPKIRRLGELFRHLKNIK